MNSCCGLDRSSSLVKSSALQRFTGWRGITLASPNRRVFAYPATPGWDQKSHDARGSPGRQYREDDLFVVFLKELHYRPCAGTILITSSGMITLIFFSSMIVCITAGPYSALRRPPRGAAVAPLRSRFIPPAASIIIPRPSCCMSTGWMFRRLHHHRVLLIREIGSAPCPTAA